MYEFMASKYEKIGWNPRHIVSMVLLTSRNGWIHTNQHQEMAALMRRYYPRQVSTSKLVESTEHARVF